MYKLSWYYFMRGTNNCNFIEILFFIEKKEQVYFKELNISTYLIKLFAVSTRNLHSLYF